EPERLDAMTRRDARRRRLGAGAVEIADRDRRAILGEPLGGRLADAASAAGNQSNASLRPLGHVLVPEMPNPAPACRRIRAGATALARELTNPQTRAI